MRHINEAGLELVKGFEKLRCNVYLDAIKIPTIGYGHALITKPYPEMITPEQAEEFLKKDIEKAEKAVLRLINIPLTDNQFSALISFTFNLGGGALQRSTLRMKVNRKEHSEVPAEFMRWIYADGKRLKGLVKRRKAEAALYIA
jgi:lysozyme